MAAKITRTDAVDPGDLFVLYKTSAGDYRGAPANVILQYMQDNLTFPSVTGMAEYTTQYSAPASSGFNITVAGGGNTHLILTPTTTFATGIITMPAVAGVVDKQDVIINCTRQVSAITFDSNGANSVAGAPSSLAADSFVRFKYDSLLSNWYRIG